MRSTGVILAGCLILCSLEASWARGASRSPSSLSAIAAEYFGFVLNCLIQTSEADSELSQWGKAEDPAGDCKFASTRDTLSISVPGTYHGLSTVSKNFLAPRVLRNVSGDFSIEVQLKCFRPLASGTSITATAPNDKMAYLGLLIWQDEKNFIRFTQAADSDRQRQVVQLHVGATLNNEVTYEFDIEYLHLKVSRIGKVFSVAVSEDGQRWQVPAISLQSSFYRATAGFGDSLRAGVMVGNGIGQEIHGEFKQLKVSTEPEHVVHDVFPASPEFRKTPLTELLDPRVQQELELKPDFLTRLKELDAQIRTLPVAERQHENGKPAREAWALLRPMLTAQQTKRLAGLELQRFGPRCLLIDIVHEQLGLNEQQLKNIERARELLEASWAARNTFPGTTESEAVTKQLRLQAYELLSEAARSASQARVEELKGDLFAYNLTGMLSPRSSQWDMSWDRWPTSFASPRFNWSSGYRGAQQRRSKNLLKPNRLVFPWSSRHLSWIGVRRPPFACSALGAKPMRK